MQSIQDSYDLVVIGSGLAGMTAANILGRAGHKVLLPARQSRNLCGKISPNRVHRH